MLDYKKGVPCQYDVPQASDQSFDILHMQAGSRFVNKENGGSVTFSYIGQILD